MLIENNIICIGTKCDKELYEELKPILESLGYVKSNSFYAISNWDIYPYLVIGYGHKNGFGNTYKRDDVIILPKEEFLKQAAAIMGKEYNIKSNKENKENMEKKYPAIKCDEKLLNEIKPILESFGIINYKINKSDLLNTDCLLISNYGSPKIDGLVIGIMCGGSIDYHNSGLRYLVDTKEEFLSAIAKLLGKEYPIKDKVDKIKYPVIKCTQQLYDKIEDIIKNVGYELFKCLNFNNHPYLVVDFNNIFGDVRNVHDFFPNANTRYECSNIREFLTTICELKGFTVSYINNTKDDDFENHRFGYCINSDNKTIGIYENYENEVPDINTFTSELNNTEKDNKDKESMEKINIAEKLKHCKKGTKLYCVLYGEVEFKCIDKSDNFICFYSINKDGNKESRFFNPYGCIDYYSDCECLLFPSKDNRDWNNFNVLEKGHRVMVSDDCIDWRLKEFIGEHYASPINGHGVNNWNFIVPVEDFDFTAEDISINKEKSIV